MSNVDALQEIEVTAERISLHEEVNERGIQSDGTESSQEFIEQSREYRYPLSLTKQYPAYITFKAVKVDGLDIRDAVGEISRSAGNFVWSGIKNI